jgi:transposase, IS30 family
VVGRSSGRRKQWKVLPEQQRKLLLRMVAAGEHPKVIGPVVGVHWGTVRNIVQPLGGVIRPEMWQPSGARLSLDERVEIRIGLEQGRSFRAIGEAIGRNASTVCREVNANGGRDGYRPMASHKRARHAARRPKPTKLACNEKLRDVVVEGLEKLWSPQQISRRLAEEFGDDPDMRVSHETIYKSLYVQGRGELRRELTRCLRSGRAKRIPRGRSERRGRIPDMVMISERPAEVQDRAVPGHWEGDLIVGKGNKSAIGTLVERSTRFVMLLHLPDGQGAESVRDAMTRTIQTLPDALRRSITWDQGKEMTQHAKFTVETGIPVYFCDPHSPWQRGSNENTNGLLRQYLPKGTDLSTYDQTDLDRIADSLNGRPRQTLNWQTPTEALNQVLVATTG